MIFFLFWALSMKKIENQISSRRKAAFLDRDGVINIDRGYVGRWQDFEFMPGIFDLLRYLSANGYLLFIITNQSGIARGFYTEEEFNLLTEKMLAMLAAESIYIEKLYYCPHHPDFGSVLYRKDCRCRKPKPGMIFDAEAEFDLDLGQSILIGDKMSDVEAATSAGIGKAYLLSDEISIDSKNATSILDVLTLFVQLSKGDA